MCKSNKVTVEQKRDKTNKIFHGMACTTIKHLYICLRTYLDLLIDFIFSFYWDGDRKPIPNLEKKHGILTESAVSLAKKIRNKELKSEDLVKAVIERIQAVNPIVNAVADERYKQALEDAKKVDEQIESGLTDDDFQKKPFLGVPFTCKESHAVQGMRHTLGVKARINARAHESAECVELLRAAGAIPVAVTNVPEINKWQETRNNVFGITCNPYHGGRTVGGSSGGEAALMASMATPISLCSDIGGSTRMPAFYCGLFGHNPTAGTTSLKGSGLRSGEHDTMASVGCISRHVEDLTPLTKVVAGDNAHKLKLDRKVDIKDVKFFYVETATDLRVSPISGDLRQSMRDVVKRLSDRFPESAPSPYRHEGFSTMFSLWKYHMAKENEDFASLLTNNQFRANGILELAKKLIGKSDFTFAAILKLLDDQLMPLPKAEWADDLTTRMKEDLTKLLGDTGVLLFPSCSHPAPYHYSAYLRPFNFAYWGIFNALRFPATQVPLGINSAGLPLGLQVAAAPHNDALCLQVAKYLEEEFGGYVPPCKIG